MAGRRRGGWQDPHKATKPLGRTVPDGSMGNEQELRARRTSGLFKEPEPEPEPEPEEEDIIPEIGETIVFRMEPTEVHQDGFGIGKVLAINDSNVHFQWYASKFYLITSPFDWRGPTQEQLSILQPAKDSQGRCATLGHSHEHHRHSQGLDRQGIRLVG